MYSSNSGSPCVLPAKFSGVVIPFASPPTVNRFEQRAVETEIELMPLAHADDVVVLLAPQQDLDRVFGVERKVIANQRAAPRAERQVVAEALVLHQRLGDLEGVDHRAAAPDRRPPGG